MTARAASAAAGLAPPSDEARRADLALRVFAGALFATLALVSLWMTGPLIHADEGSYLLNAAVLAGKLASSLSGGVYSGYSLLIVPGFLLFGSFGAIFHYVLIVNAALVASLPFALRRLLQCVAPDAGPTWRALAAAAASCQVAVLVNSQFALSENALATAYAWMLAFGATMLLRRKRSDAVVCGALAGALFLVHPRGAPMAVPVLLALSLPALRERSLRSSIFCLWFAAALVAAFHVPLEWLAKKSSDVEHLNYSVPFLLERLASAKALGQMIFNAFGAFTYIAVASFGLAVLGLFETLRAATRAWRQRGVGVPARDAVLLALLVGLAASLAVTAAYLNPPQRVDQVIYGRYTLPSVIPLLALGLLGLRTAFQGRLPTAWRAVATGFALIVLMGMAFHWLPHPPADRWVHINVLDLYIPFVAAERIDWPTIGFYFCFVAFGIYSIGAFVSTRLAGVVFAAFNLFVAGYITVDSTLPGNALRARERQAEIAVREFERSTHVPVCVGIADELDNWHALDYQVWLFDRIDQSAVVDRQHCVRGLIASMTEHRPPADQYRLISTDLYNPYGLFIQKSPALDAYAAAHPLPLADFPSPLPEDERSTKIELFGVGDGTRLNVGQPFTFRVRITNESKTLIWPALFDASPLKALRAGARIDPLDGGDPHVEFRADLTASLKPGESTIADLTIGPIMTPGRYSLDVGALQEGIAWLIPTQTISIEVVAP